MCKRPPSVGGSTWEALLCSKTSLMMRPLKGELVPHPVSAYCKTPSLLLKADQVACAFLFRWWSISYRQMLQHWVLSCFPFRPQLVKLGLASWMSLAHEAGERAGLHWASVAHLWASLGPILLLYSTWAGNGLGLCLEIKHLAISILTQRCWSCLTLWLLHHWHVLPVALTKFHPVGQHCVWCTVGYGAGNPIAHVPV